MPPLRWVLAACVAVLVGQTSAASYQADSATAERSSEGDGAPRSAPAPVAAPILAVTVLNRYPHDSDAFTEGLIVDGDHVYESVGLEGRSDVRRIDLATGRILARRTIPADQFGEGLARWRNELISLTWHDEIAHRWRMRDLRRRGDAFRYTGEGWGLASDANGFVISDGSPTLKFLSPENFAETRRLTVTLNGRALRNLNELEIVDGRILANVWMTPFIVAIDPADGTVTHIFDLRPLAAEAEQMRAQAGLPPDENAVANGIAWDERRRRLLVTGKRWPILFEIAVPQW